MTQGYNSMGSLCHGAIMASGHCATGLLCHGTTIPHGYYALGALRMRPRPIFFIFEFVEKLPFLKLSRSSITILI